MGVDKHMGTTAPAATKTLRLYDSPCRFKNRGYPTHYLWSIWSAVENKWVEVLAAVVKKSTVFWDITVCSPLKVNWSFRGTYRLHLQVRISRARYQRESRWQAELRGVISHKIIFFIMLLFLIARFSSWTADCKSVCIRKVLRATTSTPVSLVFLCLQANTKTVAKLQVANAAFQTLLHQIEPFSLGSTELFFKFLNEKLITKLQFWGLYL
jgi:hypothetical protein